MSYVHQRLAFANTVSKVFSTAAFTQRLERWQAAAAARTAERRTIAAFRQTCSSVVALRCVGCWRARAALRKGVDLLAFKVLLKESHARTHTRIHRVACVCACVSADRMRIRMRRIRILANTHAYAHTHTHIRS
jgi:hypothetical protein